jgi:hypothetical protein
MASSSSSIGQWPSVDFIELRAGLGDAEVSAMRFVDDHKGAQLIVNMIIAIMLAMCAVVFFGNDKFPC